MIMQRKGFEHAFAGRDLASPMQLWMEAHRRGCAASIYCMAAKDPLQAFMIVLTVSDERDLGDGCSNETIWFIYFDRHRVSMGGIRPWGEPHVGRSCAPLPKAS